MYADDADIANINATIRTPLNEYSKKFGVFLRRLNNNRYLLVLNEKIYRDCGRSFLYLKYRTQSISEG